MANYYDLATQGIGLFFKIGFILINVILVGFGVLLVKQVGLMTKTIKDPLNPRLKLVAWIYLFLVVFNFIFLFFYL